MRKHKVSTSLTEGVSQRTAILEMAAQIMSGLTGVVIHCD